MLKIYPSPNTPFLQIWRKISNSVRTNELYHTWHGSRDVALKFISDYYMKLGNKAPSEYYMPEGELTKHPNFMNEPQSEFIKEGMIMLSPL